MRRYHGLFRPSGTFFRHQFSADYTISMFGFDFRQGQLAHLREELCGLAVEQSASLEACDRLLRTEDFRRDRDRANDRNRRELAVEERAWLGHDQIGLEVLRAEWGWGWERRYIEVRKHESAIGQRRRSINRVASLVVPGLEVGGLGRADA